jgi:hypothetical protein
VQGPDEVTRAVVRRELAFSVLDPELRAVTPGKLWLINWAVDKGNDDCEVYDGYLNLLFPSEIPSETGGPTVDPYDRSAGIDDERGCTSTSRV